MIVANYNRTMSTNIEVPAEVSSEKNDYISIPSEFFVESPSSINEDNNDNKKDPECQDFEIKNEYQTKLDSCENVSPAESRQCWVCLATNEEDEIGTEWIHPCRCSGTAKYVHQNCLQQWIDEKQKFNSSLSVSCSTCSAQYLIVFPPNGKLFYAVELCDRILYSASPLAAITCIVGSIYWCMVCFGAFTVMQVLGKENGKTVIEQSDPLILLVGLPSIPIVLVLSKLIRWEDQILKFWLRNECRYPLVGYILGKPAEKPREFAAHSLLSRDTMSDPISLCRNFCSALILPTAATFLGGLFFSNIKSNFNRTVLGGITYIMAKGFIKILLRQHQYIRQTHRKILNFESDKIIES